MDEVEAVGVDMILTECPFCWRNLSDANERYHHGILVYDVLDLIDTDDLIKEKIASKKK